jgi:sialate O-acetylesterase
VVHDIIESITESLALLQKPARLFCNRRNAIKQRGVISMSQNLQLAPIFTEHMVLQRNKAIKVWGTAREDSQISVEFCGRKQAAKATQGKWNLALEPQAAGGPFEMKVTDGTTEILLKNIMIGEVWLAGGQSNMEMAIHNTIHWNDVKSIPDYGTIRYFDFPRVANDAAVTPERSWQIITPENVGDFSAVAFYFAKDIFQHLQVPVGIINCNWGGTSASCWMSEKYLQADDETRIYYDEYQDFSAGQVPEAYENELKQYNQQVIEYSEKVTQITIDPRDADEYLAAVNAIVYPWPPPMGPRCFLRPCGLYHTMIQKIAPYPIRGVIWYQGESDAHRPWMYHKLFGNLIRNWREDWQNPDMPFLFVQLPGYSNNNPEGEEWALLREQQTLISRSIHKTGMAVSVDCGEKDNLHPALKKTIGERLALLARSKMYGEDIEFSGPVFIEKKICGNRIILYFDHVGQGLSAKGGALQGFKISGADGKFLDAIAEIKGNTVEVCHPSIAQPQEVRYLWANYTEGNLYNQNGLPAGPFRTGN